MTTSPLQRQHRPAAQRGEPPHVYPAPRRASARLRGLSSPILGYTGTLWRDLDLAPVLYAAQAMPACTFVFLGRREKNPMAELARAAAQRPPPGAAGASGGARLPGPL
ncbi:MAG: hypothetical protein ACLRNQ_29530 [Flavonifractor plautii]